MTRAFEISSSRKLLISALIILIYKVFFAN